MQFGRACWSGASSLRTVVVWHLTWSVNSVTHIWGYRNYDTPRRQPQQRARRPAGQRRRLAQQSPRRSELGATRSQVVGIRSDLARDPRADDCSVWPRTSLLPSPQLASTFSARAAAVANARAAAVANARAALVRPGVDAVVRSVRLRIFAHIDAHAPAGDAAGGCVYDNSFDIFAPNRIVGTSSTAIHSYSHLHASVSRNRHARYGINRSPRGPSVSPRRVCHEFPGRSPSQPVPGRHPLRHRGPRRGRRAPAYSCALSGVPRRPACRPADRLAKRTRARRRRPTGGTRHENNFAGPEPVRGRGR